MSIFTAYFDESGTHDSASNVVVAGYLSTTKKWKHFHRDWSGLLRREGVRVLHRADLENRQGEFKGWSKERQIAVIRDCHEVIKAYTEKGIGGAVIAKDFNEAMPEVVRRIFGGAYGWVVHDCMVGIGHWAHDSNQRGLVRYMFEAGARGRHQVDRMFSVLYDPPRELPPSNYDWQKVLRIRGWEFLSKLCAVELQAADWFAYEIYKHMDNRIVAGVRRKIRESAWDLFRPKIDSAHYWNTERINKWVAQATADGLIKLLEDRERMLHSQGHDHLI